MGFMRWLVEKCCCGSSNARAPCDVEAIVTEPQRIAALLLCSAHSQDLDIALHLLPLLLTSAMREEMLEDFWKSTAAGAP